MTNNGLICLLGLICLYRNKKIILISHCLLNVNAKVNGLAKYKGVQNELIKLLIDEGIGIIQLPCPEMGCAGIRRWGQAKEQLDTPYFIKYCNEIFTPILDQVIDYQKNGYKVIAIIGVDGSPSCGVGQTCSSEKWGGELANCRNTEEIKNDIKMVNESGIFMEQIKRLLEDNHLYIPMLSVEEDNPANSVVNIQKFLKGEI